MSGNGLVRLLQLLLLASVVFLVLAADQDARFQSLGHKVKCICGGCNQALVECNHVGCTYSDRMRGELASYIERGDSDNLTLQAFVQKYGPTVLIAPTTTGFNTVAWVMPYLALVLGIITVVLVGRAWRLRPPQAVTPAAQGELEPFREQARRDTEV
jgi:cytochrome c-type biogenesis protein CcmH/NrfF